MQKVEGSSPFSRSRKSPAQAGFFDAREHAFGDLARHLVRSVPDSFRKPAAPRARSSLSGPSGDRLLGTARWGAGSRLAARTSAVVVSPL